MQNQWNVEVVRCINKWGNGVNEPMNQRVDEPKNESVSQWTIEWMNQRISVNEWMSESANQWISESVNQWITDWVNQTMTEPMNLWIHESMIQWINEPMKEGMGGWMNGWMGELLFRCWDTSSLTDLFAQTPLLSATSSLSSHLFGLLALSCLPASCSFCNQSLLFVQLLQCVLLPPAAIPHSTRAALWSGATFHAAVTMRLATSSCNPSCQRSVATTLILCQCVVSQPIVNPQSRSGAQNRATFAATSTVRTFRLFRSLF